MLIDTSSSAVQPTIERRRLFSVSIAMMVLAAVLAASAVNAPRASAGGSSSDLGSNGQHRRPFYIFGHNPKGATATVASGGKMVTAVRNHLNYGAVNVNVIFSVAPQDDAAYFDQIIPQLGPREGVMIDAENQPVDVYNYLAGRGATGHIG